MSKALLANNERSEDGNLRTRNSRLSHSPTTKSCLPQFVRFRFSRDKSSSSPKKPWKRTHITLLVLGPEQSGKTSIMKQIQVVYGGGYNHIERELYKYIIYHNVLKTIHTLCYRLYKKRQIPDLDENFEHYKTILKFEPLSKPVWVKGNLVYQFRNPDDERVKDRARSRLQEEDYISTLFHKSIPAIKALWADKAIRNAYTTRIDPCLQDSAHYFLDDLDRISERGYIPNDTDIVNAYAQTIGMTECRATVKNDNYLLYDLGGHSSQRHHWISYYEACECLLYVCALSTYDQVSIWDPKVNRLEEAVSIFHSLCTNPLLRKACFVVFLNKIDVMQEKMERGIRVSKYIELYKGPNQFDPVTRFFWKYFTNQNKGSLRLMYIHFTTGINIDPENPRVIFPAAVASIHRIALENSGYL
ncbi:uncharacterized protein VTP21DRAFT_6361 [Calcarisporiella thermophila]|uniref:uncharacterized protein n=1 Tax=Calcarisporiella thermophila TaxID=911321 RepID=UPI003742B3D3